MNQSQTKKIQALSKLKLPQDARTLLNKIEKALQSNNKDAKEKANTALDSLFEKVKQVASKQQSEDKGVKVSPKTVVPKSSDIDAPEQKEEIEELVNKVADPLQDAIESDPALKGFNRKSTDVLRDSVRAAMPRGRRVSKKGWKNQFGESKGGRVYYETRENRSDRKAPITKKTKMPWLEDGGNIDSNVFEVVEINNGNEMIILSNQTMKDAKVYAMVKRHMGGDNDYMVRDSQGNVYYSSNPDMYAKGGYMAKGGGVSTKYVIVDEDTDRIYFRSTDKKLVELKFKEFKEIYPNANLSIIEFPNQYADGGYMAKGGMTQHNLMVGDTIKQSFGNIVVVDNDGKTYVVNINTGQRWSDSEWWSLSKSDQTKFTKMADGGEMDDDEGVDLFEDYEDQPEEVSVILSKYELEDNDYDILGQLLGELEEVGYTFEYGLDGEPYDLRKIGQKGKSEFYAKGGRIKGDTLESVRKIAKTMSRNQDVYVLEQKSYEFLNRANPEDKSILTEYNIGTQEDVDYIKEMPKNTNLASVKIKMKYSKGELKSAQEELIFSNDAKMAKGGAIAAVDLNNLKKGSKLSITFSSPIKKDNQVDLIVRSKNIVNKGKKSEKEKITFINLDNPSGVKFYAYKDLDDSYVGFAMGDLAIHNVKQVSTMAKGGEIETSEKLPHTLNKYFIKGDKTIEVPLEKLTPTRAREKGIENAEKYMRMAYNGEMERRKPITIYSVGKGRYKVADGNSTYAVAKKNGWKTILADVVKNPSAQTQGQKSIFALAKEIRKDGEAWQAAIQRAKQMK